MCVCVCERMHVHTCALCVGGDRAKKSISNNLYESNYFQFALLPGLPS